MAQKYTKILSILCITNAVDAKVMWNLESAFLMHLQQNQTETKVDDPTKAVSHIYPTWVEETTCATRCVDSRKDQEFCVATAICEYSAYLKAAERQEIDQNIQQGSDSSCAIWADTDRCDGVLC